MELINNYQTFLPILLHKNIFSIACMKLKEFSVPIKVKIHNRLIYVFIITLYVE